ncbi:MULTISPECIES: beta-N-acetylhexosaminidase [Paenibacillus]|uniref:beta-N-acetylhexosaminidase n=1 Tax=Paenibacillus TaxID=44249 RepID=UPI002FE12F43
MTPSGKLRYAILILFALVLALGGCSDRGAPEPVRNGTRAASQRADAAQPGQPEATSPRPETQDPPEPEPGPADAARELLKRMTTAEKIGQLILVGLEGTKTDEHTRAFIEDYHVGGFIFYKDNIKTSRQSLALFNQLKKDNAANPVPLFLSVDEEGGRVSRMPGDFGDIPSAAVIGGTEQVEASEAFYRLIGEELAGFGLNMDFAPVLDIHSNPANPVIGDRSFGSTAQRVSGMGVAAMNGLKAEGVIPVIKHFPGHGDTSVDSHLGLPVLSHDLNRLRELELLPFRDAIREGADVVMIAHLLLPKLDPKAPASFSEPIIHDLLRTELDFQGVVISDDLTMGAITQHYEIDEAAVRFIKAGGNIALVGHDPDRQQAVIRAIMRAVEQGEISGKMLDERVYPILQLKIKYGLTDRPAQGPDQKAVNAGIVEALRRYDIR